MFVANTCVTAQLLQDMPSSDALFIPSADSAMGKSASQVYYDSPVVTASACAVVASLGLTMQFYDTVLQAPVVLSINSQCSHTLMSASYARRMKLHVEQSGEAPLQVAVANGQVCTAIGICKVRLKLQEFSGDLTCHVVELADACEVILGEDWLSKYSATLSSGHKICILTKGSQRITLLPGNADVAPEVRSSANAHAVAARCTVIQARRALANGCHAFWQGALMYRLSLLRLVLL